MRLLLYFKVGIANSVRRTISLFVSNYVLHLSHMSLFSRHGNGRSNLCRSWWTYQLPRHDFKSIRVFLNSWLHVTLHCHCSRPASYTHC